MMPARRNFWAAESKNTSMRNVRSTCESMAQHTSPNSSRAPGDADEYPAITVVLSEWSAIRKLARTGFWEVRGNRDRIGNPEVTIPQTRFRRIHVQLTSIDQPKPTEPPIRRANR